MASEPPRRIQTIGRAMGRDYDEGVTFEEALLWTQSLKLSWPPLTTPIIKNVAKGKAGESAIADFPLDDNLGGLHKKLHQWVEVIHPYEDPINATALETILMANQYNKLPEKLRIKGECPLPYTMQLFISDNPDNSRTILKHFVLEKEAKLTIEQITAMAHGTIFKITYGTNFANGSKAWQYCHQIGRAHV